METIDKKEIAKQKREIKKQVLIDSMRKMIVNTLDGKQSMYNLCFNVGVDKKVVYFNYIEKLLRVKKRTIHNTTHVVRKDVDYGFIFKNGLEIKHVSKKIYPLFDVDVIEKRERV